MSLKCNCREIRIYFSQTTITKLHFLIYFFLDKPEVSAEDTVVYTGVGHQAILVCNIHSSPDAEVVWYRGTLLLEPDNRMYREVVGTRHSLVLHHVREEEFTTYRCQATNSLGSDSATVTISGEKRNVCSSLHFSISRKTYCTHH